jgi:hypothetical protein
MKGKLKRDLDLSDVFSGILVSFVSEEHTGWRTKSGPENGYAIRAELYESKMRGASEVVLRRGNIVDHTRWLSCVCAWIRFSNHFLIAAMCLGSLAVARNQVNHSLRNKS